MVSPLSASHDSHNADLARALVDAETRERRKVAELLHDDVLQLLAAARMALSTSVDQEHVDELILRAIRRGRQICRGMEPTPLIGDLDVTLPHVVDSIRRSYGLSTQLEIRARPKLHETAHDVLLSCAGELLANVARHAPGSEARLTLNASAHWVWIRVDDDGPGFGRQTPPPHPRALGGLGLPSLQRRLQALSGDLDWWTRQPSGAAVMALLPL